MKSCSIMVNHAPLDRPNILSSPKKRDGLVHPVLDSLDNYKILSERMNVLTIYLPRRKFGNVLTSAQPESAVTCMYVCTQQLYAYLFIYHIIMSNLSNVSIMYN